MKYIEDSIFSLICYFSILQQDIHNSHLQNSRCHLFEVEMKYFLISFKLKFNSSRTIPSWERKLEIVFIPSEVIPQPEK